MFPPDFRSPGQTLWEVDPLGRGSKWWWGRRWLDDDITVQGVYLALNPTVRVFWVLLLISCVVVFERIPLVVGVKAVLFD